MRENEDWHVFAGKLCALQQAEGVSVVDRIGLDAQAHKAAWVLHLHCSATGA